MKNSSHWKNKYQKYQKNSLIYWQKRMEETQYFSYQDMENLFHTLKSTKNQSVYKTEFHNLYHVVLSKAFQTNYAQRTFVLFDSPIDDLVQNQKLFQTLSIYGIFYNSNQIDIEILFKKYFAPLKKLNHIQNTFYHLGMACLSSEKGKFQYAVDLIQKSNINNVLIEHKDFSKKLISILNNDKLSWEIFSFFILNFSELIKKNKSNSLSIYINYWNAKFEFNQKNYLETLRILSKINPAFYDQTNFQMDIEINLLKAMSHFHLGSMMTAKSTLQDMSDSVVKNEFLIHKNKKIKIALALIKMVLNQNLILNTNKIRKIEKIKIGKSNPEIFQKIEIITEIAYHFGIEIY